MSTSLSRQEQELTAQITEATNQIAGLENKLRALDELLKSISNQQNQYQLLSDICTSLEKLDGQEVADIFWTHVADNQNPGQKLTLLKAAVAEFQQKVAAIDQSRKSLQGDIQKKQQSLRSLNAHLAKQQQDKKQFRDGYVVTRSAHEISHRPVVMPWSKQGEDERRFHFILAIFFLLSFALGVLVSVWELPPPDEDKAVVVPERLAQLIKKKKEVLPEPKPQEKKEEKPTDKEKKQTDKGAENISDLPVKKTEKEQARATAETKGVLALKDSLAELMKDSSSMKLGAETRISVSGKQTAAAQPSRAIIVAQGGSGGISSSINSTLSRRGSENGKEDIASPTVKIARVESAIGAVAKEIDRPLRKDIGPSRTDEEIQIVFDRYKSALYRLYNRELRSDPSLRGKMVLRITIETDGHVSACSVKSSDLASPTLSGDIVERVLKFNFGPKEGVPAVTILYPIEFLPAV